MRNAGLLLVLGGTLGVVGGVMLTKCDNAYDRDCTSDKVGGVILTVLSVPTAIVGITFTVIGQSRVASSDSKLRALALAPSITPTSAGFSMTGTF